MPRKNKEETGRKAHADGFRAEKTASFYLMLKGYKILEKNFKPKRGSGAGEIDLIALKKDTLVFFEIKYRRTAEESLDAFSPQVLERRVKGAEYYLMLHPEHEGKEMRFDALALTPGKLPIHIQNAWDA